MSSPQNPKTPKPLETDLVESYFDCISLCRYFVKSLKELVANTTKAVVLTAGLASIAGV